MKCEKMLKYLKNNKKYPKFGWVFMFFWVWVW